MSKRLAASRTDDFSRRLLSWFRRHGRGDLPWQKDPTPYRVWISEIMLQQTHVNTVVDYYRRFIRRFPHVKRLAAADIDNVLHVWSGLGYYARARNLHCAADIIAQRYGGRFPTELASLRSLPGIGRSTAGAILALACGQRHPILDGNVKRVLCRMHGIEGWPGRTGVAKELWALADRYTPQVRVADYTQAIMDLGATVCTRTRPACARCPVRSHCRAHREGRETVLPTARPRRALPVRQTTFVMLRRSDGAVLLERRPPVGVWGALWSFPECPTETALGDWCRERLGHAPRAKALLPCVRHTFSHFHLDIVPALVEIDGSSHRIMDDDHTLWYKIATSPACGLAAPVETLLRQLDQHPTPMKS